jgi:hypothetical protein
LASIRKKMPGQKRGKGRGGFLPEREQTIEPGVKAS